MLFRAFTCGSFYIFSIKVRCKRSHAAEESGRTEQEDGAEEEGESYRGEMITKYTVMTREPCS